MSSASFIIPLRKHSHTLWSSCFWEKLFWFCFYHYGYFRENSSSLTPKTSEKDSVFPNFHINCQTSHDLEKKKTKRKTCLPFLWPQRAGPLKFLLLFSWWHHCGHRIGNRGLLWSKTYFLCTLAPLVFELPSCHSPLTSVFLFGEKPRQAVIIL